MHSSAYRDKCWGEYKSCKLQRAGPPESIIKRGRGEQFNVYSKGYKIGVAHLRPLQGKEHFKNISLNLSFYVHISSSFKNASFNSGKLKTFYKLEKLNSLIVNTEIWAIEQLSLILKLIFATINGLSFFLRLTEEAIDKIVRDWKTLQLDD